ncbi:S8 family serine peptidase [Variovorax sp. J22R24]|uniref:S8 family serine peptidase n=1 Tax=Variovorax gracilis TaxID=3053502 RepID=UPI002574A489|nr:S8 family serine peptidase [Variovorax sp. J22R24]MDM0108783.1 S8 family serine peptidase [Variovorax sp. J22R24]
MANYFYRRGQRVPVDEVQGVVGVRVESATRAGVASAAIGSSVDPVQAAVFAQPVPAEEVAALSAAGWSLVHPSADLTATARAARSRPQQAIDAGQVYQQRDGHLLIDTRGMIVQFPAELSEPAVLRTLKQRKLEVVRKLGFAPNQFQVRVPVGVDTMAVANELQESRTALAAEPEFIEFIGQRLRPTDPSYNQLWHLNNAGGSGGVAGADIAAERAWDFTLGRGVRVAVIDNGFDVAHPDLAAGIAAESGFFDATGNFQQTLTGYPDNDHGTFCAGMVGARHNNGRAGCGSAPECELLLVASLGDQVGTQATLARAVAYAADPRLEVTTASVAAGADVIVSSLGPNGANWALTTVLDNALVFASRRGRRGRGTPIFWASSNGNNVDIALDQVVSHPMVIAVGRSRRDDMEDNSARGAQLDFLAPGVNVVSTGSGGGTRTATGTSFAAPLAAGVGALALAANPDLRADEICDVMRATCDKIGGVAYNAQGHHTDYGYGRVNAFRTVMRALQTASERASRRADFDADGRAEIPVTSPWGIGILKAASGSISHLAMAANGTRIGGWLLNTVDNRFPARGRFASAARTDLLVTSPWGIGVLRRYGSGYRALMMAPNGTRFGGWLLNTGDNVFGPVGDFDGDGLDEIMVRSPWGIGLLKLAGGTLSPLMMAPNGTRFGGWLLNTADNRFGPVGDFDGNGRDEIVVSSPWGIGMLAWSGTALTCPMLQPNGTRFGGWLLNTADNWFGPAGDYDRDGRSEFAVTSPWGLGLLKLSGATLTPLMMAPNGTRFGGWLLNSFDNRLRAAVDLDGDGRDELLIGSPWGIGVLAWSGSALTCPMLQPNGMRFGGWLLNTADNEFRVYGNLTQAGRAQVFVESPWGVGVLNFNGSTFQVPVMKSNGSRLGGWLLNTLDNRFE